MGCGVASGADLAGGDAAAQCSRPARRARGRGSRRRIATVCCSARRWRWKWRQGLAAARGDRAGRRCHRRRRGRARARGLSGAPAGAAHDKIVWNDFGRRPPARRARRRDGASQRGLPPADGRRQSGAGRAPRAPRARRRSCWHRRMATPRPPRLRLQAGGFDLIAELKLRSPAVGQLEGPDGGRGHARDDLRACGRRRVSVLTEPTRFDGSWITCASRPRRCCRSAVPAMRKDFLVDPYQVSRLAPPAPAACSRSCRMLSPSELEATALIRRARWSFSCCSRHSMSRTSSGSMEYFTGGRCPRAFWRASTAATWRRCRWCRAARAARRPPAAGDSTGGGKRCRVGRGCAAGGCSRL